MTGLSVGENWKGNSVWSATLTIAVMIAGVNIGIVLAANCRRLNLPVRDYLGSVLPGLAAFPINRVAELTPSTWAARN